MDLIRRLPYRLRAGALIMAALLAGAGELALVFGSPDLGIDFVPLRDAAEAVTAGDSVYRDPTFVYPPIAAVLLLPTTLGSAPAAFAGWVALGALAMVLASVLVAREATRHRLPVAAAATAMLLSGPAAAMSLHLGNLSELLVPVAVAVLLAFHRRRWAVGCALLAVSLLLKPLLAPLVLIPVLRRRWAALAGTMIPAGVLLLGSVLLVPGGERFFEVLRYCLSGTNLHGVNAVNNLSLRGWFEAHQAPALLGAAAAVGVLVIVAARTVVLLRHSPGLSPVRLGNIVMLGTLLSGAISEVHFLLVMLATVLLQAVLSNDRRAVRPLLPGLLMLGVPSAHLSLVGGHAVGQSWFVAAELCLLAGLLAAPVEGRGEQRDPVEGREEQRVPVEVQAAGHGVVPDRRPVPDPPVPAQA